MKHVFGKRNYLMIFLRKMDLKLYRYINKLKSRKNSEATSPKNKIVCYPVFDNIEKYFDFKNRLSWAFPYHENFEIYLSVTDKLAGELKQSKIPESIIDQGNYLLKKNDHITNIRAAQIHEKILIADLILIHDKKARYNSEVLFSKAAKKVVDPTYFSLEESNFWKFGFYDLLEKSDKQRYYEISSANFKRMNEKFIGRASANIFVTGPSFSRYKEYEFDKNSVKIVCNTIIKDEEFLDYIGGPDILTFADPVFHFCSNEYADVFRELVLKTVKKYNCFVALPASTVPLMLLNYPDLKDYIIGFRRSENTVIPDLNEMFVKPTGSIITFLMIPIASAFAKKVYILGADGRGKKENYFWKHNSKVQLDDLMQTVYRTHPSFFRDRRYQNHYKKHCEYFEEILEYGEKKGIQFLSLNESFIPAMKKRMNKN